MLLRTIAGFSFFLAAVLCAVLDAALWLLPVLFCGFYAALLLLAFLILWAFSAVVDMEKPQEEDSRLYRLSKTYK